MAERNQKGRNPVLPPDVCIPDGEAHVFEDRLYVYGSCDQEYETYCSKEYYVVSTGNMQSWTVHPVSFSGKDIPWAAEKGKDYPAVDISPRNPTPFVRGMLADMNLPTKWLPKFLLPNSIKLGKYLKDHRDYLWAPDCAYRNGKYYLYFCTSGYLEGVAVSDRPEGPFENPVQLPCGGIDPAVFIDDDGKVYYYWGQFRASAVELNEDMCTFDENAVVSRIVTEEEHGFHEGSSMRKRNGIYYYVYPCVFREGRPTCLAYATSESPLGPFTYRGIIVDNAKCDPESWNIHGSIECFRGQWYVFYHRSSQNSRYHRRLCVEPITFNEDGTINEVKMTSIGAGEPFAQEEIIEGWRACEVEGGAYIAGTDLVMPKGSQAVFRYIQIDRPVSGVQIHQKAQAEITVLLNGEPAESAAPGLYEILLVAGADTVIHSVCFGDAY